MVSPSVFISNLSVCLPLTPAGLRGGSIHPLLTLKKYSYISQASFFFKILLLLTSDLQTFSYGSVELAGAYMALSSSVPGSVFWVPLLRLDLLLLRLLLISS